MTSNERSLFWIEPATLTGLLATVSAPANEPPASRTAWSPASGRVAGRPTRPAPEAEGQDPGPAPGPRVPLVLPRRPFEARLAALLGWLEDSFGFEQAFVIDADGLPLIEEQAVAELVATAAALGRTCRELRRSGELDGGTSVTLEMGSDKRLYLLADETPWGLLQLGVVTDRRLEAGDLDAARDAFHRTVDDKETDRS